LALVILEMGVLLFGLANLDLNPILSFPLFLG
jgi:hypothetical protein